MTEQEPTIQTPEWIQNNLKVIFYVPSNGKANFSFDYVINGCQVIGNSGIYIHNNKMKWDHFFPKGEDGNMPVNSGIGYGTLSNTLPLLCLINHLDKTALGSIKVGEDHKPSDARIGLLKSIDVPANPSKLISFGEYIAASLEACKRKGYQINRFTKTKLPPNPDFPSLEAWEYSFPFSDMNLLGCQQCILHGSECRLNKVMTVNDLLEVLNSSEGAPVSKFSTRLTRSLMDLVHRSVIDGRGGIKARCFDNRTGKLTGEYPIPKSEGMVKGKKARELILRFLRHG